MNFDKIEMLLLLLLLLLSGWVIHICWHFAECTKRAF